MIIARKCFSLILYLMSMFTIIAPHHTDACESKGGLFAIASDSTGNFITVWVEKVGEIPVIKSSRLVSGKDWTEPVIISNPESYSLNPIVEMDENGNAVVLWRSVREGKPEYFLQAAKLLSGSDRWSEPETISDYGVMISTNNIELEVSSDGNIVAIWGKIVIDELEPETTYKEIRASMSTFNTSWSTPITISKKL